MQSQKDSFTLSPIGYVRTVFTHTFGTPRQGLLAPHSEATFELEPRWRDKGIFAEIEGFSHVWLISLFHRNKSSRSPSKIHPPRLLGGSVGVLASRSPHRPNPLGLTLAQILSAKGDDLYLGGIDLVDGTPILDIKPYLPEADRPTQFAKGWTDLVQVSAIRCEFDVAALRQMHDLAHNGRIVSLSRFTALIEEVLGLDPRPLSYRQRVNERFAVVLDGLDVHARYNDGVFTVISVQPFAAPHARRERTARETPDPTLSDQETSLD